MSFENKNSHPQDHGLGVRGDMFFFEGSFFPHDIRDECVENQFKGVIHMLCHALQVEGKFRKILRIIFALHAYRECGIE